MLLSTGFLKYCLPSTFSTR